MAHTLSVRQERFCLFVVQGIPPSQAYPKAGYRNHKSAASRLYGNVNVKARIAAITKANAMKSRVTVESLTVDLDRIAAGAEADKQWAAAKGAVDTKAKLHGHMIDRKETGQPGEFANLATAEDVLALVAQELGAETAALLTAALAKADEPESDPPARPVRYA